MSADIEKRDFFKEPFSETEEPVDMPRETMEAVDEMHQEEIQFDEEIRPVFFTVSFFRILEPLDRTK